MKRIMKWFWLLNKRLYKKLTFLLILLLIPALIIGYGMSAQEESGVMTVALAQKGNDPMASQVIDQLMSESSLIRFVLCDTHEDAKQMIEDGKADAAWLFPEEMESRLYRFINNPSKFNAFIQVVEREASIPMKLSREKLSGTVFSLASRHFYLNYLRENVPELDAVSDEELLSYYDNFATDIDLFTFESLDSPNGSQGESQSNYLLAPVRGLLAVVIVLGGLAAAMYYIRDYKAGTFSLVPQRRKGIVEFVCQVIAVGNIALVTVLALILGNMAVSIGREVFVMLLYCLAVALFCMNIRRWCGKISAIGAALPLLIVVMLIICPVFIDLGDLRPLQYLFPPTYYVNAIYSDRYMLLLCIYNAILWFIYLLSGKLLHRR